MNGNFIGYLLGYIIAIIGVGYGLNAAGVPQQWIIASVLVMVGLGVVYALSRSQSGTRKVDSHTTEHHVVEPNASHTRTTTTNY